MSKKDIKECLSRLIKKQYIEPVEDYSRYSQEKKELSKLGKYIKTNNLKNNRGLDDFYETLSDYSFEPYRGISIKKSSGKLRPLLVPHPKDRIILGAVFLKLSKILLPILNKDVVLGIGLNKKKDAINYEPEINKAFSNICDQINNGHSHVLKLDFKDFFSTIDRKTLLFELSRYVEIDSVLYKVISNSLWNKIDAVEPAKFWGSFTRLDLKNKGIPQGLAYSPLLATFFSIPIDNSVSGSDCRVYRYIDDMIVLCSSYKDARNAYERIKDISDKLKLNLHRLEPGSKTEIIDNKRKPFIFLGIEINNGCLCVPNKAVKSFMDVFKKEILNEIIINKGSTFEDVLAVYKDYVKGWSNYYKICNHNFSKTRQEIESQLYEYVKKSKKISNFCDKKIFLLSKPYYDIDLKNKLT